MGTTNQTEEFYSRQESVGVAVSPFTSIPSPAPAHRAPPFARQVLVGCAILSSICVLSMFLILGVRTMGLEPD